MKNIFSKTTENRTQNGVKSYLCPTRLLSPILIFTFLTLGVGQMRGASTVYGGYIYFDEYNSGYTGAGDMQFWIGHNSYSCAYSMSKISNTKLWYCQASSWGDATYFAFTSGANWGGAAQKYYDRIGSNTWKSAIKESYILNSGSYYVFKVASTANKAAVNSASPYGYQGNAVTSLNKTITVKAKVSTDGGGNYKEETSPGTLSASSYKFTDYNSCASATSLSSGTISCGYTATTTLTATDATGYDFVGWYNASGVQQTTSKTLTIYPTEDAIYYAFFKRKQFTVNFEPKGTFGTSTVTAAISAFSISSGSQQNYGSKITFTASPAKGYFVEGWYSDAECTVPLDNGQKTTYRISSLEANSSVYVKFMPFTISATMTPTTGATGVAQDFSFNITSNAPLNSGYYVGVYNFGEVGSGEHGNGEMNGIVQYNSSPTIYYRTGVVGFASAGIYTTQAFLMKESNVLATSEKITYTAGAGDSFTVSFNMNGHGDAVEPQNILSGNTATVPSPEPTATGYTFGGWYENPECTGSAFNFSTAITVSRTLYAKWTPKTTTVTLDQQSGTGGTANVTATYDAAMPAATMPKRDNYTFNGYFTGTEGSGTKYYNADGTSAKNWDIEDATKTLYAHWTEIKYEVTISVSNSSATTGTINCSAAGWVPSNNGTAQIGNATEVSMIVGAPASGYTWGSWVLSGGVELISGNLTDAKIVVKATSAGTATYTYVEDLSTEWKIIGQSPSDKANSPFSSWTYASSTNTMAKATGHSTESVAYATISVPAASVTGEYYEFKISNGTTHYGYGESAGYYILFDKTKTDKSVYSNNNNDHALRFKPNVAGDYTFKIDYSNNPKTVSVTFPTAYTVTYGVGTGYTSMGGVSTSPNITSGDYVIAGTNITFTATPNLGYKFVGWYNNAECTGNAISTNATYNIASLSADTYLYAKFDYRPLYIHADFAPNGWNTPVQMTQSTENRAVYTYEIDPLAAKSGTPASEGHHFHFVNTVENPNDHKAYNYKGVQTPTGSGFLTNEDIHLTDEKNATIQFDLMRKSKITITLTLKSIDDDPKPTVNIAADPYYTVHTATGGSGAAGVTISPESVEARSGANSGEIIATIDPGYTFTNWTADPTITITSPNDPTTTVRATGEGTLIANATANSYTVHFDGNGNTGGLMNDMSALTYGVAFKLTANAFTKTGYTFAGWATEAAGAVAYTDGQLVYNLTDVNNGTATLYAKWTPKNYTVTLDKQTSAEGYGGNEGTVANQTVTFDATPATVSGSMPIAKNGWAFMGFYSAKDGGGRQFINPLGNWVTNAGDTIRDSKWVYDGNVTLYAYYKKAQITNLIFDAAVVAPGTEVGVTPTVDPKPAGTNSICWKLLYNNGNLYTPQPEFRPANPGGVDNKVTFNAPPTSGMYLVAAVLRTGTDCNGGTKLDSVTYPFQVAGDHTVTVQYKCGDVTLQGSTSVSARPLDWSEDITPDEIFGYSFEKWVAGEGVSMTIDGETTIETGGETTGKAGTHAVQIKAIYDGKLIAQYTKKNIIYFKNTLGWSEVYVNLYPYAWWDKDKGAGNNTLADDKKNKKMTQLGETDIWYYEYGNTATTAYVSFTDRSQNNYAGFAGTSSVNKVQVSYPTRPYATEDEDANYGFNAGTPMFVPTAGQTAQPWNKSGNDDLAEYYNKGYWRKYDPIQGETGYTLKVYNMTEDNGRTELKSIKFVESDVPGQLFKAVANLEAAGGYGIKFERDNSMLYTNISGHLQSTGDVVVTEKQDANYRAIWIKATAAGDYTFAITINGDGKLCIQAEFPVAKDDYRVIYTDNATWTTTHTLESWIHPSRIITAEENAVDTISFFVSKGHSPEFRIQQVNTIDEGTGAITWTDVTEWTSCNDVDASGVYNFIFTQDGSKNIRFTKKEPYTGNFYIRTDAAGSTKWDNYRAPDHQITYSEYSITHGGYSHYYCHWVDKDAWGGTRKNIKFCIANDYSPCISDTLIRENNSDPAWANINNYIDEKGNILRNANVRFMWNQSTNKVSRAYVDGTQGTGSNNFLYILSEDNKIRKMDESALDDHKVSFSDNENWIYEANIQAQPKAAIKLLSNWGTSNTITQYFKGSSNTTEYLIDGSGEKWYNIRLLYDFKTNRLVAAMVPTGNIDDPMPINADVMFIREHQGDIEQLTFTGDGVITEIKTAYAVMRFNKWTLNNKDKDTHKPLASPASIYERSLYYVSFPFPVNLSEVFGFGTYGQHWIIQRYRGDLRAQQGFWAESDGFWEFIWNRNGVVLQPNEGYILTLETELLGEESDVWGPDQRSNQIELFFPSSGNLGSITNTTVNCSIPEHTCTIDKTKDQFGNPTGLPNSFDPSKSYNRTVFDSHWNIMSVPTYVNVNNPSFANTTWIANESCPRFLYTWNMDDNTLTATSGKGFMYHAMHAYTVQYYGDVTWTTSVTPPAAPQRNTEYRGEYEFCLEVQQDEQMIDRTFVRLSDDENVTTGFEFSEDMTKQFNSRKANIFTIAGNTSLGGNSLPLSTTQTTVVPVGVKIKTAGDYTFSIPEGTDGIGVTLVDNETGVRTLLSALDYTVNLTAGDYTERFWLEISPIYNTPTGIEEPTSDSSLKGRAQKRIIDGVLYIVKDGKIFDARGTRVE